MARFNVPRYFWILLCGLGMVMGNILFIYRCDNRKDKEKRNEGEKTTKEKRQERGKSKKGEKRRGRKKRIKNEKRKREGNKKIRPNPTNVRKGLMADPTKDDRACRELLKIDVKKSD